MTGDTPEVDIHPAKKRKIDHGSQKENPVNTEELLFPFRLVPSPQEARSLETSTFISFSAVPNK